MKRALIVPMASACLLVASSVQAALNLVSDPGFNQGENGVLLATSQPWFNPGYFPGNPIADFPNVSIVANATAPTGWNAVLLPFASENAVLLQQLTLTPGIGYTVNFWLSTPTANGGTLDVSLNGTDGGTMAVAGGKAWTDYNLNITPSSSGGVLEFLWIGAAPNTPVELDSVAVSVPEPTTMVAGALMLLPFAASTLRMKMRKKA